MELMRDDILLWIFFLGIRFLPWLSVLEKDEIEFSARTVVSRTSPTIDGTHTALYS